MFYMLLGWFGCSQVWEPSSNILGPCLCLLCEVPVSRKPLSLWELAPSRVLHTLRQPDLTPQEGPFALAPETDPSCAPWAAGWFLTSEPGLLVLAFPGVGASLPLLRLSLQGLLHQGLRAIAPLHQGRQHQACPTGHVVKELKPRWGVW